MSWFGQGMAMFVVAAIAASVVVFIGYFVKRLLDAWRNR